MLENIISFHRKCYFSSFHFVQKRLLLSLTAVKKNLSVWCLTVRQHRIGQFVPTVGG